MIPMCEAMLGEVQQEAATTRRVLERVPEDKLSWRPHKKSMTLGQLALHLANVPGSIARISQSDEFDASKANFGAEQPKNIGEIFAAHDESIRAAEDCLRNLTEDRARAQWKLKMGPRDVFSIPRASLLRSIMLNHWYHHRGQLSVYLRLLDVALPSIYGPSADENPFS
ncbi:MAG TPA: DinB family protein [Candidatus Aquilonibacter sp.]|nr:DinB family protein [Candidatus Aquilonibacter sp.]